MNGPVIVPAVGDYLEEIIGALRTGAVVALPTDTVYGLVCLPEHAEKLFTLKGRPADVNVQVLVGRTSVARSISLFPLQAERLARRFWPGALTLVVARAAGNSWNLGANQETIGIRHPLHSVVLPLCLALGPLAATSANRHGEPVAASAAEIAAIFPDGLSLVLDGGECAGVASTVVDLTGPEPQCLREGAIAWKEISAAIEEGGNEFYWSGRE